MFAALSQAPGMSLQTRKVLIIINLQNDSLITDGDIQVTANHAFVDQIKAVVPHFRSMGEIIWVRTEITRKPEPMALSDPAKLEADAAKTDKRNREERRAEEQNLTDDTSSIESDKGVQHYHPTSRVKATMKKASAKTRLDQRSANLEAFDDQHTSLEDYLTKPRKGKEPAFFVGGTHGAELADSILPVVDKQTDMIMTKHYYSAFDQTSLLMALRMKLVTEIYLCGCLTNVGIYSTAADAVQHGMDVTVIEDCLGYRSEEKHDEAMRQMADIMGVHSVDAAEIIEEAGGAPPPDAELPMFTGPGLEGISMNSLSLVNSRRPSGEPEAAHHDGRAAADGQEGRAESPERATNITDESHQHATTKPEPRIQTAGELPTKRTSSNSKGTPTGSQRTSFVKRTRDSWPTASRTFGPHDAIGSGDSRIIHSFLSSETANRAFAQLKSEVKWQTMSHRSGQVPRLVAVQGKAGKDGGIPIYRHPADESPPLLPFTPAVEEIRTALERSLKQPFNHVLIQLYRDGNDNISEHSDKVSRLPPLSERGLFSIADDQQTLDIVRKSAIVNVSIGAQRLMTLRTKKSKHMSGFDSPNASRQIQRIPMPHNSVFVLGPETNMQWLHGVRADKRPLQQKSEEERSFGGERISLTFRHIGTFTDQNSQTIWGQGARVKSRIGAGCVRASDSAEIEAMVMAFGKENHQTEFDWQTEYGKGFDAINLVTSTQPTLVLCRNKVANLRVQLSLLEKKISYTLEEKPEEFHKDDDSQSQGRPSPWSHGLSNIEKPILRDTGEQASDIEGDLAILFHLEKVYPHKALEEAEAPDAATSTRNFTRAALSNELLSAWQNLPFLSLDSRTRAPVPSERPKSSHNSVISEFEKDLETWEGFAKEHEQFIAGDSWTLIDCAFWPVLNEIVHRWKGFKVQKYPQLSAYHERVLGREFNTLTKTPAQYIFPDNRSLKNGHMLSLLPTDPPKPQLAVGFTTSIPPTADSLTENPAFLTILQSIIGIHAHEDPDIQSQAQAMASTGGSNLGSGGSLFPQQRRRRRSSHGGGPGGGGDGAGGANSQGGIGGAGRGSHIHVYDYRHPPDFGRIPDPEDIFGSLEVDGQGRFVDGHGNYQTSGTYRMCTRDGM
ncbi:MAG: hypothetical protein LQ341_003673 [Variospora aurantia]|nr:MAG: hypothetical protein LQ341_003673 [Variospora aurantia]